MNEIELVSILTLGFMLGIKHALEPDHIIGVSTIASQSKKLSKSALAGVFWGVGHTATLLTVGMGLIFLKSDVPEKYAMSLEFLVGIMLVYFGLSAIYSHKNKTHSEAHGRSFVKFSYGKALFMGFIHGLAGSAALVLLTMSTVDNLLEGGLYIVVFGAGTVVSMLFFTTIIGIPFIMSANKKTFHKPLIQLTGVISTLFGIYYMYNLGVTEGLFKLWI
ncbi:sulfite exporter TauE/SafE family protein [Fictibacillus barbaricus]|uniref:Sulfite exporter TauE/SafE family protein n=1 Tax=Fictibacillus barbaricus TaxID=182136 RepID=A0ABS2ZH08_9BACL|nr:sulfite exporter TauE/SafE family protein [Fictibacillus barbaricus]MBN3546613.1 sulfite exporter TauE/SafE family protein [Fictibacillus barbaricus]GGB42411.1 hydantoin utilization protein A [Fictibacillus barbaricus]